MNNRTRKRKSDKSSFAMETTRSRDSRINFSNCPMKKKPISYSQKRKNPNKQSRNIENVTLGDVRFEAWYSSWYPKEFLGKKNNTIKDLYICPRCFAYTRGEDQREIQAWFKHWQNCNTASIPGEKIYVHGEWVESNEDDSKEQTRLWSIWEVDGATETLFCQKLSLFAKLFLENKSVFFDVSGFKFFLLVYTAPNSISNTSLDSQIIGFFSKEKMSWDNNNLACILIFPPWQRKGLGSLLIGISYAIAQRNNIMGGPERPISELGLKGYRGFWSREIARFLLSRDLDVESCVVDTETISRETWISPDDCLAMIKEMDILDHNCDVSGDLSTMTPATHKCISRGRCERWEGKKRCFFIDKQRVRDWVSLKGFQTVKIVSERGFRPGYALKPSHDEAPKLLNNSN